MKVVAVAFLALLCAKESFELTAKHEKLKDSLIRVHHKLEKVKDTLKDENNQHKHDALANIREQLTQLKDSVNNGHENDLAHRSIQNLASLLDQIKADVLSKKRDNPGVVRATLRNYFPAIGAVASDIKRSLAMKDFNDNPMQSKNHRIANRKRKDFLRLVKDQMRNLKRKVHALKDEPKVTRKEEHVEVRLGKPLQNDATPNENDEPKVTRKEEHVEVRLGKPFQNDPTPNENDEPKVTRKEEHVEVRLGKPLQNDATPNENDSMSLEKQLDALDVDEMYGYGQQDNQIDAKIELKDDPNEEIRMKFDNIKREMKEIKRLVEKTF